ncbi:TetR family transcriptional regulator [Ferrovibrio sp. MS7]|uniref:TetR/AcrR family transcriptional regulator n=1 Tax=Ferrovibrio plantarum TaxID=3119164 RepID=UPI0031368469
MAERGDIAALPNSDRLLEAALASFRQLGSQKARIEDIAAMAGMARTALYRFYPSKRAILAALAARTLQGDEARLAELARDRDRSPAARLKALLLAEAECLRLLLADRVLAEVVTAALQDSADVWEQHRRALRALYAGVIRDGQRAGRFRSGSSEALAQTVEDMSRPLHDPRILLESGPRETALAAAAADWLEKRPR